MLTALLTALAFIVGMFAERLVWAVAMYLAARWVVRRFDRAWTAVKARCAPLVGCVAALGAVLTMMGRDAGKALLRRMPRPFRNNEYAR